MTRNQLIFLDSALKALQKATETVIDVWNDPNIVGVDDKALAEIAEMLDSARSRLREMVLTTKPEN